jgi:hypothetical protein
MYAQTNVGLLYCVGSGSHVAAALAGSPQAAAAVEVTSRAGVSVVNRQMDSACVFVSYSVSASVSQVCQCQPGDRVSVHSGGRLVSWSALDEYSHFLFVI